MTHRFAGQGGALWGRFSKHRPVRPRYPWIEGTMNCLACGHDNRADEESCASCSASLRLKLCGSCEAIIRQDADRCHNCGTEGSLPSAWVISGEPRRRLRAALLVVPALAAGVFAAYHFSHAVPEAQAVTAVVPKTITPASVRMLESKVEPQAAAPRAVPRVTHTRGVDSAASGGASGPAR